MLPTSSTPTSPETRTFATTTQAAASATSGSGGSSSAAALDSLANEQTFLQLLVAQMQNQDPTAPQDGTQFVSQLAQFSSLEQEIQMRTDLDNINSILTNESSSSGQSSAESSSAQPALSQPALSQAAESRSPSGPQSVTQS